jgi:hypothetical protein
LLVFFLLRTGITFVLAGWTFGIDSSTVSRWFTAVIRALDAFFQKEFPPIPLLRATLLTPPYISRALRGADVGTFVADGTEFKQMKPSALDIQRDVSDLRPLCVHGLSLNFLTQMALQVWSAYKHYHSAKVNVTAHAAGFFIHISDPYGGSISDDDLLVLCGIMAKLPPGCRLLLDKGYKAARTQAMAVNITVHTPPPRERSVAQLEADKVASTARIAAPRVVVENLLARPKGVFNILSHPLPVAQLDLLGPMIRVCCFLTNYMPPLRKGNVDGKRGSSAKKPPTDVEDPEDVPPFVELSDDEDDY